MEIISLFSSQPKSKLIEVDVSEIETNPNQPRKDFYDESIDELAQSISKYGLIQPITVRKGTKNKYQLVSGERRLRACIKAGLKTVDAIFVTATNCDSAAMALIENLQRENLNFLEEGEAYSNLITDFCLTQEELAGCLGKSQAYIANKLRTLKLSDKIKAIIRENKLTERHARALLKIDTESLRQTAVEYIVKKNLNVAEAEKYISSLLYKKDRDNPDKKQMRIIKDIRVFSNTIKQAVDMMKQSGINAYAKKTENDEYIEYVVKIPKIS